MIGFLALAFIGGLISCASTCFLPLVPAYVTYMGGRAISAARETAVSQQLKVLSNALLFVAGFTTVFVLFGAAAGLIGADLRAYRPLLSQVAGIALVVMGLALLGFVPWLMREARLDIAHRLPRGPWGSYLVGLAFAIGWTPCVGPILAAILIKAGDTGTAGQGALLLAAYSAGLAIPFLVAAGLVTQLSRLLPKLYVASRAINSVAAVFMIGMGLLIFSNRLTVLNSYLPYFSTPFQDALNAQALQATPDATAALKGPVRVGQAAPNVTITDINGHQVSLGDLRGRPLLINFWATWCTPCREELPLIVSAYRAHRAEGFTVVAVDYQESPQVVKKFWDDLHLEPTPFLDPDAKVASAYGVGLSSSGLPVSVFIARDGTVSAFAPWALDPDFFAAQLKRIL